MSAAQFELLAPAPLSNFSFTLSLFYFFQLQSHSVPLIYKNQSLRDTIMSTMVKEKLK